jgi:DNA-binding transcriptional LysR family regulator
MDKLKAMGFFCRTVEARSFSAAAKSLDLVPSALSKVVASLEQEIGFALFNRSTRRLALTDEGGQYYERCRAILAEVEAADGVGRQGATHARGSLRVGLHPALRQLLLARLGPFLEEQPALKVETVITNAASAVVDEGLDLVLHIGPLTDSSLVARSIGWARPIVCASPAYLATHGEPRQPEDLAAHRAVIYARRDEASNTRWRFTRGRQLREVEVPVHLVSRDGVGLVDAALGGCGIARPFDVAAAPSIESGHLRKLLADWTGEPQAISLVLPAHGRSSVAKVRLFSDYVVDLLSR